MFLLTMLALSTFARADVVILDCNVEGGDQQVRVLDGARGLQLEELNTSGRWKNRALTAQEWGEKVIKLTAGYGETYTLSYSRKAKAWFYLSKGPGMTVTGMADCAE